MLITNSSGEDINLLRDFMVVVRVCTSLALLTGYDEGCAGGGGDGGHLVGGVAEVEACVGGGGPVDHQLSLADACCQDRAGG